MYGNGVLMHMIPIFMKIHRIKIQLEEQTASHKSLIILHTSEMRVSCVAVDAATIRFIYGLPYAIDILPLVRMNSTDSDVRNL